ncbi:hypothetical protein PILCRDRAFT_810783 [Piloderma croceum F 1598]|uniref:Uncharacterized protein n=1 Tax=Piloderma croceum (strain F 1598) TaxID=765440 RepID=A0A0C3GLQ4_PILCF|nr:hypothetical protein PILCRDRAFT_810783 [Piloderma croceum F 1598]
MVDRTRSTRTVTLTSQCDLPLVFLVLRLGLGSASCKNAPRKALVLLKAYLPSRLDSEQDLGPD